MERLTNREQQVFNAILAGKRTCEIRKEMNIATSTIRTYYKHIYSKLFVNSKKEDVAHQGLFGITYYLYKNKIPYHIHGHIHNSYKNIMINGTKEISVYMYEYIELKK